MTFTLALWCVYSFNNNNNNKNLSEPQLDTESVNHWLAFTPHLRSAWCQREAVTRTKPSATRSLPCSHVRPHQAILWILAQVSETNRKKLWGQGDIVFLWSNSITLKNLQRPAGAAETRLLFHPCFKRRIPFNKVTCDPRTTSRWPNILVSSIDCLPVSSRAQLLWQTLANLPPTCSWQ